MVALGEKDTGLIALFQQAPDGWVNLATAASGGRLPCHACWLGPRDDLVVVVAHYGDGAVTALRLRELGHTPQVLVAPSEGAHAHAVVPTPEGLGLFLVDLGRNTVELYRVGAGWPLTFSLVASLATGPGSGPRHLAVHPRLPVAYLVTEFSNELVTLRWSLGPSTPQTPGLEVLGRVSLLPEGAVAESFGAAVKVSSDGKFVLATNRGHNSVVSFSLDSQGTPQEPVWTASAGDWPRDLALSPDGSQVAVANQRSGTVALFDRNPGTGALQFRATEENHQPSVVVFNRLGSNSSP